MSIGEQLRQARETQQISLDQAAQATHIRLRYLQALEGDQFDLLPSSAQLRGFLRAYGDYLKLSSADLLVSLDGNVPPSAVSSVTAAGTEETVNATDDSEAIFKELGKTLRSQRELMGLSLGDVERHTHIRMHSVQALEEGEISYLPSPVQGRGMLSNYASFLGLNTESVLLRFADGLQASLYHRQKTRSPRPATTSREQAESMPARPSQFKRFFSMDMFISGMLIIFLLGFIVWGALRVTDLRSKKSASPTAPPVSEVLLSTQSGLLSTQATLLPGSLPTSAITSTLGAPIVNTYVPSFSTETPTAVGPTPGIQNAPVQLYVVAQRRVWMRVTVDGEVTFQGRVMPGSAYSYAANEEIVLLTGDAGGLQVYFNQQDLGILGDFGEVAQRIFTIQGMETSTIASLPTSTAAPTGTVTPTPTPTRTSIPPTATSTPKP